MSYLFYRLILSKSNSSLSRHDTLIGLRPAINKANAADKRSVETISRLTNISTA